VDVYNVAFDSDDSTAIDRDGSFHSYIAHKVEEILNTTSSKGNAKNAKTQLSGSSGIPGSKGKTSCNLNKSKATVPPPKNGTQGSYNKPQLEPNVRSCTYLSLVQS
jgi:hypothetical protein